MRSAHIRRTAFPLQWSTEYPRSGTLADILSALDLKTHFLRSKCILHTCIAFFNAKLYYLHRSVQRAAEDEALSLDICLSGIWRQPAPDPDTLDVRARIARHYYLGLSKLFSSPRPPSHAIILEDDLDLSPDFLSFLLAFASRTSTDPSRGPAAISGWNDNGASRSSPDAAETHLASLFPGLGWLLPRSVWLELEPHWPCYCERKKPVHSSDTARAFPPATAAPAGWDWWLRAEFQARGWSTLYPLLGRVSHRGAAGANVAPGQQRAVFAEIRTAGDKEALSPAAWAVAAKNAQTVHARNFRSWLDAREMNARAINALSDITSNALVSGESTTSRGNGRIFVCISRSDISRLLHGDCNCGRIREDSSRVASHFR